MELGIVVLCRGIAGIGRRNFDRRHRGSTQLNYYLEFARSGSWQDLFNGVDPLNLESDTGLNSNTRPWRRRWTVDTVSRQLKAELTTSPSLLQREVEGLLRLDASNPIRLISRENNRLEYKETFNWTNRAKYAKTMAAFANNRGGFIVFGVKNSPHDLVGVDATRFDALDPSTVTGYLNSRLVPEVEWERFCIQIAGVQLGVIAVTAAEVRPIVCVRNDGSELREADIFYRYRGRSQRMRYPELQRVLEERQERERKAWFQHLSRVARIGVENVGVLNLIDGELSGPEGHLLVSEELLQRIQFIREGRFTERHDDGAPTLRLVGEVQAVAPSALGPVTTIAQPLVIGEKELVRGFLRQEHLQAPTEYVKQACRERSSYMPVYYFAGMAGLRLEALRAIVVQESAGRDKLLQRVDGVMIPPIGSLDSDTAPCKERLRILEKLQAGNMDDLLRASRIRLFEAVTHLEPSGCTTELLRFLADFIEDNFDNFGSAERSLYRKAVARLDELLNRPACTH